MQLKNAVGNIALDVLDWYRTHKIGNNIFLENGGMLKFIADS